MLLGILMGGYIVGIAPFFRAEPGDIHERSDAAEVGRGGGSYGNDDVLSAGQGQGDGVFGELDFVEIDVEDGAGGGHGHVGQHSAAIIDEEGDAADDAVGGFEKIDVAAVMNRAGENGNGDGLLVFGDGERRGVGRNWGGETQDVSHGLNARESLIKQNAGVGFEIAFEGSRRELFMEGGGIGDAGAE